MHQRSHDQRIRPQIQMGTRPASRRASRTKRPRILRPPRAYSPHNFAIVMAIPEEFIAEGQRPMLARRKAASKSAEVIAKREILPAAQPTQQHFLSRAVAARKSS